MKDFHQRFLSSTMVVTGLVVWYNFIMNVLGKNFPARDGIVKWFDPCFVWRFSGIFLPHHARVCTVEPIRKKKTQRIYSQSTPKSCFGFFEGMFSGNCPSPRVGEANVKDRGRGSIARKSLSARTEKFNPKNDLGVTQLQNQNYFGTKPFLLQL